MIRIAICESDKKHAQHLRLVLDTCVRTMDISNAEIAVVGSYADLGALLNRLRLDYFDLIFCRMETDESDEARERVVGVIGVLKERSPRTRFVLMSSKPELASCAYESDVAFLSVPFEREAFLQTVGSMLKAVAEERHRRFGVKASKGTVSMNLHDVTFAETGKRGPVIHLRSGREVTTRGTLQALYDRLAELDKRFVRAGGSFIINLDNVRSVGESSVIFGDGATIILPTRARKPVREAFSAYQLR